MNTFSPINQIPSEIFSLIPGYLNDECGTGLVTLTHVCRAWWEIFISHSSLWAPLNCRDVHKTLTYIERSKSFSLDIRLEKSKNKSYSHDALYLVVPHISRLNSLSVSGPADVIPDLVKHFSRSAPLLRKLEIDLTPNNRAPSFPATLSTEISFLHELRLTRVAQLPLGNLPNFKVFRFHHDPGTADALFITQLLDFFESAPLLSDIELHCSISIPATSNTPSGRVIAIPHLKKLTLYSPSAHSTLLKHLSLPIGSTLVLEYTLDGEDPSVLDNLEDFDSFSYLTYITSISLLFGLGSKHVRFGGPSGQLYLSGIWTDKVPSLLATQCRFFGSLQRFNLSNTQRLTVTEYTSSSPPVFQTLVFMNNFRTLTLIKCKNLLFICALNPEENNSGAVACPNLEELVIHLKGFGWSYTPCLKEMASARTRRYTKRPSITIIGLGNMLPKEKVFALREYFPRVEYKVDVESPEWDDTNPSDGGRGDGLIPKT